MKNILILTVFLTFAVNVWFAPLALTAAKTEGSETKIPETQTGILREIKTNEKVLAKIIDDKKLREVNGLTFAIRDLVNALPGISPDFDTEKKAQLEAIVKSVTALAEELKKSSDARELTVTQVNFTKLQEGLRKIESLYPDYRPRAQHHSSRRFFRNK